MKFKPDKATLKCLVVKASKRKLNPHELEGRSRIIKRQNERNNKMEADGAMMNKTPWIVRSNELEKTFLSIEELWGHETNLPNLERWMDEITEISHPTMSLFSTKKDIITTVYSEHAQTIFYICLANGDGSYLPLMVKNRKLELTKVLFGTGFNKKEAETDFIHSFINTLRNEDNQYILTDSHAEYMVDMEISNKGRISFHINKNVKQIPFNHDADELHAGLQKKVKTEMEELEKLFSTFLKMSSADMDINHMDYLYNNMKDYVIRKNVCMKILEKTVADWTMVYKEKDFVSIPFPYETMNYLLLPEVNALDVLTRADNVDIDYAIDNPEDFREFIFSEEERWTFSKSFI